MKVVLSIKPEFAYKIFDGSKKFEFRKSIFKNEKVTSVIVYASSPVQQVIGEFEIEDILNYDLQTLWAMDLFSSDRDSVSSLIYANQPIFIRLADVFVTIIPLSNKI